MCAVYLGWVLVGFCWMLGIKVMSLELLHHIVGQFVMVPQIVEEIRKVLQAALFTALDKGLQVSTVRYINALSFSASRFAAMRLLFQSSRFTRTIVGSPTSSLRYVFGRLSCPLSKTSVQVQKELKDAHLLLARRPPFCILEVLLHRRHWGVIPVASGTAPSVVLTGSSLHGGLQWTRTDQHSTYRNLCCT